MKQLAMIVGAAAFLTIPALAKPMVVAEETGVSTHVEGKDHDRDRDRHHVLVIHKHHDEDSEHHHVVVIHKHHDEDRDRHVLVVRHKEHHDDDKR